MKMRCSRTAIPMTAASSAPGATSIIVVTSWPAARNARTEVAALIGQKAHSPLRLHKHRFLMGKHICRIGDGGVNVVAGEMRIGLQQILLRGAFGQFPQNQLHGDPGAADDRLPEHHLGIDLYPTL